MVRAVVGVKVTVMVQVAAGMSVLQLVAEAKNGVVLVGWAIWRSVGAGVGEGDGLLRGGWAWDVIEVRAVGSRARPWSGLPKPVRVAVTGVVLVGMVRVPVIGPVVVGENWRLRKQEALGAREPVQGWPPVG